MSRKKSEDIHRALAMQIRARKLPEPQLEVVFMRGEVVARHTKRRKLKNSHANEPEWRFDFAWPEQRIAIEIEGVSVVRAGKMFVIGGRHGSIEGFKEDCEKYAWAAVMGWRVLRFEQTQVKAGLAIDMLVRMFAALEVLPAPLLVSIADIERAANPLANPLDKLVAMPVTHFKFDEMNRPRAVTDELHFGASSQKDPF